MIDEIPIKICNNYKTLAYDFSDKSTDQNWFVWFFDIATCAASEIRVY